MSNDLIEEEAAIFNNAAVTLPFSSRALHDLLTLGVCVRCIFRLSGVRGPVYSCSSITSSMLCSILKEKYNENGFDLEDDGSYCCICLGILQFACDRGNESSVEGFVGEVAELIGREGYQIDGFCLEFSVPAVVVANERALWLYMRRIYDSEKWFKNWFPLEQITVKDALRLSITRALERRLNVKCGVDSFRLRLTFTHLESSARLQHSLVNDHGFKRRKIEGTKDDVVDSNDSSKKDSNERLHSEADASILRAVNSLQDPVFIELFPLPPQKVYKSCQLTTTCLTMPIYIGGRYLKFSRKVSQSRWIIDDERMGAASVEEIVGSNALSICKGDSYKFHAAGREDIDVRMLGSGRPFLIEVSNARCMPSMVDVQQIAETINNSIEKYVTVRNLKVVGSEVWNLMREGEAEKQKQYAAVVWTSQALTDENLDHISSKKTWKSCRGHLSGYSIVEVLWSASESYIG